MKDENLFIMFLKAIWVATKIVVTVPLGAYALMFQDEWHQAMAGILIQWSFKWP